MAFNKKGIMLSLKGIQEKFVFIKYMPMIRFGDEDNFVRLFIHLKISARVNLN